MQEPTEDKTASGPLEYNSMPMNAELYGQFILAITTNFLSNKGKSLQYLSNELFRAALADINKDKPKSWFEVPCSRDLSWNSDFSRNPTPTPNYYTFIRRLAKKTGIEFDVIQKSLDQAGLPGIYHSIRVELMKTRICGVGKTSTEKAVTMLSDTVRLVAQPINFAYTAKNNGISGIVDTLTTPNNKLGRIKQEAKDAIATAFKDIDGLDQSSCLEEKLWQRSSSPGTSKEEPGVTLSPLSPSKTHR